MLPVAGISKTSMKASVQLLPGLRNVAPAFVQGNIVVLNATPGKVAKQQLLLKTPTASAILTGKTRDQDKLTDF